jgi:hypothetical protein
MAKFLKGKPRPASAGRRKGSLNKKTLRAAQARKPIDAADHKAIVDKVVEAAKNGDAQATQVYFRHLCPPTAKVVGKPIDLEPPSTAQEARDGIARITSMIARTEIDGEHGGRIIAGLEAYIAARTTELEEIVKRLQAEEAGGAL